MQDLVEGGRDTIYNHLLFKAVLVLHIAIVLQDIRLVSQNEGGVE